MEDIKVSEKRELQDPEGRKLGSIEITIRKSGAVTLQVECDPEKPLELVDRFHSLDTVSFIFRPRI